MVPSLPLARAGNGAELSFHVASGPWTMLKGALTAEQRSGCIRVSVG